jgi:hypothetical protein
MSLASVNSALAVPDPGIPCSTGRVMAAVQSLRVGEPISVTNPNLLTTSSFLPHRLLHFLPLRLPLPAVCSAPAVHGPGIPSGIGHAMVAVPTLRVRDNLLLSNPLLLTADYPLPCNLLRFLRLRIPPHIVSFVPAIPDLGILYNLEPAMCAAKRFVSIMCVVSI